MDEEVQIMGDSQDAIPLNHYGELIAEWNELINSHDLGYLLNRDMQPERKEVMGIVKELGLDYSTKMLVIAAIDNLWAAKTLGQISTTSMNDEVSKQHIYTQPEKTKKIIQELAKEVFAEYLEKNPSTSGGTSRASESKSKELGGRSR